jgi:hypothetical protein
VYATPLQLPDGRGAADGDGGGGAGWRGGGGAVSARVHSVFNVPGMHLLPDLLLSRTGLKQLYDAKDDATRERRAKELCKERFDARIELERFADYFNPHYLVERKPSNQALRFTFSSAEDRLFATGLRRYGLDRFDAIRQHLLPTKPPDALRKRYDQASARRAESNPIKRARFDYEPAKLSLAELAVCHVGSNLVWWLRVRRERSDATRVLPRPRTRTRIRACVCVCVPPRLCR